MGGKQQGGGTAPTIRPRGPVIAGPIAAGPPLVRRFTQPANNSFRDTAAPIVGTIAGFISNAFYPGTGAFASKAAERTVKEQVNVVNGQPFFSGIENDPAKAWPDMLSTVIGSLASYGGANTSGFTSAGIQAAGTGANYGVNQLRPRTAPRDTRGFIYGGY